MKRERRLFRALQLSDTRCVSVLRYSECILMRVIVCSAQLSLLDIVSLKVSAAATNTTTICMVVSFTICTDKDKNMLIGTYSLEHLSAVKESNAFCAFSHQTL